MRFDADDEPLDNRVIQRPIKERCVYLPLHSSAHPPTTPIIGNMGRITADPGVVSTEITIR